jgi:hypothetical protein
MLWLDGRGTDGWMERLSQYTLVFLYLQHNFGICSLRLWALIDEPEGPRGFQCFKITHFPAVLTYRRDGL